MAGCQQTRGMSRRPHSLKLPVGQYAVFLDRWGLTAGALRPAHWTRRYSRRPPAPRGLQECVRARCAGRGRQRSKRLANSVKAASAGVSIGVDIGSISQIDHEMKVYLRSTTFQMSRTLTGSTRFRSMTRGDTLLGSQATKRTHPCHASAIYYVIMTRSFKNR